MLKAQEKLNIRIHKGMPLVWISDCYFYLGYPALSKRYLMLTLCEDSIRDILTLGKINTEEGGVYFRLVWKQGMTDSELNKYALEICDLNNSNEECGVFPEWILQNIEDKNWMTYPSSGEVKIFIINPIYVQFLIQRLGKQSGKNLELLAEYLLLCMPGCKTTRRKNTYSTEYDIVCSMEGFDLDFRSELGRYFVCECKDLKEPADVTVVTKFCRLLDSIKAKFGILFTKNGITGQNENKYADREINKVYLDRGIIIIVIDKNDLNYVLNGVNFINLLRERYEKIRLDLY